VLSRTDLIEKSHGFSAAALVVLGKHRSRRITPCFQGLSNRGVQYQPSAASQFGENRNAYEVMCRGETTGTFDDQLLSPKLVDRIKYLRHG
jgi:hypothetical protein